MVIKNNLMSTNLKQVLQSPRFYISIIGVCLLGWMSIWEEYRVIFRHPHTSVNYFIDSFIWSSMYDKLVILMAAVPFAVSFCYDWNHQYIKPVMIRSGLRSYTITKAFTCFLSAFLVTFIGMWLFVATLSIKLSLYPPDSGVEEYAFPPFTELASGRLPVLYMVARLYIFSLSSALWSVVGLAVSAYIPNAFVALASPIVFAFALEEVAYYLPEWLNLYSMTKSVDLIERGAIVSLLYFSFVFITFSVIAGVVFHRHVVRRVRNEVV